MANFTRTILIPRAVKEVFDFATNVENARVFMPGVTKIEMVTEGGMRTGAKFRETRSMKGKEHTAVIEVIEHDRPKVHAARSAMLGMRATYTFRFTPEGAGTRVELRGEVAGNILWWPFLGMIRKMMEREDGEFLVRLRDAMAT